MQEAASTHISVTDLISVIVPLHNSEKYLRRCIESIIQQTYKNIEIILINDGSTDRSGEICNEYSLKDNRVRVIHTKNNGPAAARNIGIKDAKGSFMFFIDADDFMEANALNLLIEAYRQHKADITIGDFIRIKGDNSFPSHNGVFLKSKLFTKQDIIDYTISYLKKPNRSPLFAYSWGKLFKASIIKDNSIFFNADLRTFEDVAFNFDYLKHTNEIFFLKETLYNHSIHNNYISTSMMSSGDPKNLFGHLKALVNVSNFLNNRISPSEIRRETGHACICLTIIQLVRACGQINNSNKEKIYELVYRIITDSGIRDNLQFYSPSKGDSRILPLLMKLKLVWPIILVCRYKAHKRYGEKRYS